MMEQENTISLIIRLGEWNLFDAKFGDIGRIIVTILVIIFISYLVLYVARVVVALAMPTMVIVGLLVIYSLVSNNDKDELSCILDSLNQYIDGFMQKAIWLKNTYTLLFGCS